MSRTNKEIFESGDLIWMGGGGIRLMRPYYYLNAPAYCFEGRWYSKAALELKLNELGVPYDNDVLEQYRTEEK